MNFEPKADCVCGHAYEKHGGDTECPGYTGCRDLDCSCHVFELKEELEPKASDRFWAHVETMLLNRERNQ